MVTKVNAGLAVAPHVLAEEKKEEKKEGKKELKSGDVLGMTARELRALMKAEGFTKIPRGKGAAPTGSHTAHTAEGVKVSCFTHKTAKGIQSRKVARQVNLLREQRGQAEARKAAGSAIETRRVKVKVGKHTKTVTKEVLNIAGI